MEQCSTQKLIHVLTGEDYETYDLDYVLALSKRFSEKGYKIYLDYRKLVAPALRTDANLKYRLQ